MPSWRPVKRRSPLDGITLDHVLSGDTCAPISLADLETYLEHKEYSIENLHFASWYQNYRRKFSELPERVQVLSPPPSSITRRGHDVIPCPSPVKTEQRLEASRRHLEASVNTDRVDHSLPELKETGPLMVPNSPTYSAYSFSLDNASSPFKSESNSPLLPHTPPCTLFASLPSSSNIEATRKAEQPFRHECMCAAQTFVKAGSSKEITLDSRVRDMVIRDLTWSTHPDIFLPIYEQAYDTLSTVSLPHFLMLSSTNVNRPKAFFWLRVGILNLTIALIISLATILSIDDYTMRRRAMGGWDSGGESRFAKARAWRMFAVPFATLGGMQFYSFYRGFCSDVWGRGRTQLRPWELDLVQFDGTFDEDPVVSPILDCTHSSLEKGLNGSFQMEKKASNSGSLSSSGFNTVVTPHLNHEARNPEKETEKEHEESDKATLASVSSNSKDRKLSIRRIPPPKIDTALEAQPPGQQLGSLEPDESCTENIPVSTAQRHKGVAMPDVADLGLTFTSPSDVGNQTLSAQSYTASGMASSLSAQDHFGIDKKIPMFGPERMVLDKRIAAVHRQVLVDMLWIGLVWGCVFTAIILALPGRRW